VRDFETDGEKRARFAEALARITDIDTKARCEESLIEFVEYCWPIVDPATPFLRSYVVESICDHLEAVANGYIKRLLINVSPGSTKSTCLYMFSAWEWGPRNCPWTRYICASYSEHLSERDNVRCRHVVSNERFRRLWGDRFEPDLSSQGKKKFSNNKTGWRFATSVGGVSIGERGDRFLIDDPNSIDAESEVVRKNTNLWFTEVVPSRLNNLEKSAIILIQQRLHEEDCTGVALSKEMGFTHLCIPLEYEPRLYVNGFTVTEQGDRRIKTFLDDDAAQIPEEYVFWRDWRTEAGENAWPERYPPHIIEGLKRDQGPIAFAGQYQQRVVPRGGAIVGRHMWRVWEQDKYPDDLEYIVAGLDTAYTDLELSGNDPSALTIWGVYRKVDPITGKNVPIIILLYAWARWLKFHDLVEVALNTCTRPSLKLRGNDLWAAIADVQEQMRGDPRFPIDRLLIENSAVGRPAALELERIYGVNAPFGVELITTPPKSKVARLWAVEHLFDRGQIFAPNKHFADQVIDQMAVFPFGAHDDLVDSATMCLAWLRDQGFLITREERLIEEEAAVDYRRHRLPALYPA
jgi:predicted phage terminase large subunit-like protein